MRKTLLLLLALTMLPAAPPASKSGLDPERLARIPARMKAFVEKGEIPGSVTLIGRHGQIAHIEAVGWADIEEKKPMRTDTIFQIMSMTKPVTGVAVMMLVEEGKLSVNDPVEKHLPEFKGQKVADRASAWQQTLRSPARPITIRDLMTHTSGMSGPHGALSELYQKMDVTLADAVKAYAKEPLEFEPGSKWMYSNTGIATLGRLVEVASDMPFEQFLATRIFVPLGMKDSFIFPPADKTARIATVYNMKEGRLVPGGPSTLGGDSKRYRPGAKYSAPEFGLYSTATDLFAFYQMMLNNGTYNGKRLLSKAAVDVMTMPHTGDLKAGHLPGTAFGLTWEVVKDTIGLTTFLSPGTFGHGGAFGTHGWIDRQKDLVGVFLVQRGSNDVKNAYFQLVGAAVTD
jgi:CubicO group peptidase (beta-lactamase class C family)